eukprot:3151681-Rhodomonas_salina.2
MRRADPAAGENYAVGTDSFLHSENAVLDVLEGRGAGGEGGRVICFGNVKKGARKRGWEGRKGGNLCVVAHKLHSHHVDASVVQQLAEPWRVRVNGGSCQDLINPINVSHVEPQHSKIYDVHARILSKWHPSCGFWNLISEGRHVSRMDGTARAD